MMMITWVHITLISSFSVVIIVLILILIRKKCSKPTTPSDMVTTDAEACHEEMIKTPHQNLDSNKSSFRPRKSSSSSSLSFFCWSDHPALLAHAVENGWPRFCFVPSPPLKPSDDHDHGNDQSNVVISWEVFDESADYMQKMRLNPRRDSGNLCVIRTALPLPGPQFGNAPFPKEAYFEVTILGNEYNLINGSKREKIEEEEEVKNEKDEIVMVGIGLTGGGKLPLKFPGSFPGSVSFNSTGSLFLDGMKVGVECESEGWGRVGNVIGCGYNPPQKKVFFTLNSKLINEIRCKTEEFGHPLYPTLAANVDVTVVVNLGQSPFKYEAANPHRTANPCFITPQSTHSNYDLDSKELFSMGRIDVKWKQWTSTTRSSESIQVETDQLSEADDLFEIHVR